MFASKILPRCQNPKKLSKKYLIHIINKSEEYLDEKANCAQDSD